MLGFASFNSLFDGAVASYACVGRSESVGLSTDVFSHGGS
jgi:hypothetical protein